MPLTPGAILLWGQIGLELATMAERFAALNQRIMAGEPVTEEEMQALRQKNIENADALDAAAIYDKEDTDGR